MASKPEYLWVQVSAWFFIQQINELSKNPSFHFWMGMTGGLVLITFGILSILNKHEKDKTTKAFNAKSYLGYWTKGFAVNFLNPFTFVFWVGVMTSYVLGKGINGLQTLTLFSSIMVTIMTTDSLKVVLAKLIRSKMKNHHILLFSRIAGVVLIIFGFVLLIRTNVFQF